MFPMVKNYFCTNEWYDCTTVHATASMTIFEAIILGFVQGVTEFLPISSSGHLIIARELFGISDVGGLAFDAVLQLATAFAIVVYFSRDLWGLLRGVLNREHAALTEVGFLAVATVPAVALGVLLESYMEHTFRSELLVIGTLLLGAVIMGVGEWFVRNRETHDIGFARAVGIGFFSHSHLFPG